MWSVRKHASVHGRYVGDFYVSGIPDAGEVERRYSSGWLRRNEDVRLGVLASSHRLVKAPRPRHQTPLDYEKVLKRQYACQVLTPI